ncbi:MAG: type II toxin-antitoxin system prevent-host-death family antitoxin [Chloroflexi bacterium]|nr:type II toxin-antitoxin system prevent-host-death family antitoxin [Chloroflexota bacterium]
MVAKMIDVKEALFEWKELLTLVQQGGEVILTKHGTPVARLTPVTIAEGERILGLHAGSWTVSDDFDEPLPDDFWLGEA